MVKTYSMFEELCFRLGIPTYVQALSIDITTKQTINFPKNLPEQIGWIYGINTWVDGKTVDNAALITEANAILLWLTLVAGQTQFINPIRVDDLIFDQANGCDQRYMPINIPAQISLDQCFITNPTAIASGVFIFNMRYIDMKSYNYLVSEGLLRVNGESKKR